MEISGKKSLFLAFIAAVLLFFLSWVIGNEIFQNKSYNFMVKYTSEDNTASKDIILVVIDNKSLAEVGRWPWKRDKTSEIFEYLENYTDAKAIAYDAVIIAPDTLNPDADKIFFNAIGKYNKLIGGVGFIEDDFLEFKKGDEYNKILPSKSDVEIIDNRSPKFRQKSFYKSFTPFVEDYFKNIKLLGSVNTYQDQDGYIRKIDQLVNYNGKLYPSLALMTYSKITGIKKFTLDDEYIKGENSYYKLKIPVKNEHGIVFSYVSYYKTDPTGTYSHNTVSASDILTSLRQIKNGEKPLLDSGIFSGKAVFVGANANAQALSDIKRTPISDSLAGVDVQATNFNNMLDNSFMTTTSRYYDFFVVLFCFLIVIAYVCILPVSTALLCTTFTMLLYFIYAFIMYDNRIAVGLIMPEIFMLFAIGCGYSFRYLLEGAKKEKIQSAMSKYISKDVMNSVVQNIDSIKLGGKRAEVTVLFADIRGFTSISEQLSAEEVSKILNEYFSELVPLIEEHKGVLNKFMGDALLAIFGEPIKDEDHPVHAVKCADKMLKKVRQLQEKWLAEGKPKIETGIGIATGEVFIGNIGSETRLEYTVIGDTVNTASRIENYNKVYRTNFLISEETYQRVQKYVDVIKIREVSIRGKAKKINIYEVLRILDV
ncbi:MAG: adenylate/guanylate cyclase domain-containing protein [Candidatus Gastranaerophilales bacterium]|nr:adenylate/guanylate cyclase domain-containing protein [Candidatus Gastranaerophilales bacterium]